MSIGVRRAKADDAAAITAVHDAAWRHAYRGILPGLDLERMVERRGPAWWQRAIRRHVIVMVLEVGGQVAGYATMGPNRMRHLPFRGEIYEIYMLPEYQGIGLGGRLFGESRRTLQQLDFRGLAVRALAANEQACGFYRRMGGQMVLETVERVGEDMLPVNVFGWNAE